MDISTLMYGPSTENLNHLYASCPLAISVWQHFAGLMGLPPLNFLLFIYFSITGGFIIHLVLFFGQISKLLPLFICWELWIARNLFQYDGESVNAQSVIYKVLNMLQQVPRAHKFSGHLKSYHADLFR